MGRSRRSQPIHVPLCSAAHASPAAQVGLGGPSRQIPARVVAPLGLEVQEQLLLCCGRVGKYYVEAGSREGPRGASLLGGSEDTAVFNEAS